MVDQRENNLYWIIDHDELCWAPGKFVKDAGDEIHVQCIVDNQYFSIEKPAIEVHPSCLDGAPDLLSLGEFNEGALLHTIRTRHSRKQIYTSIGTPILISVNPYQKLKIFTTFIARKYREYSNAVKSGRAPSEKPEPHLFMVAEDSYQDMFTYNKNQSIIISGESGAGKTEATKIVLKYLAQANTNFVSPVDIDMLDTKNYMAADHSIEKQVLDSNPLLEAFGNAKTKKNNNSSRFGKFIRVNFEPSGKIHSATIINYLLEKSRIVLLQEGERNFHIFYQMLANKQFREKYQLGNIQQYQYLNRSPVWQINGIDDAEDFALTIQCMKNIGFTQDEIDQVLNIVVGILLLGNLQFDKVNKIGVGDISQISKNSENIAKQICELFKLTPVQLAKCLTTKVQVIGKDRIESNLGYDESIFTRDAMAKSIYGKLFNWLVDRINQSISQKMGAKSHSNLKFIGLLDIFGFEIFQRNSFEQLCINYANEKLQQHFNHHMFNLEQEEYKSENIQWSQIKFVDNQMCIDLIENLKTPSLFKLLDEECMIRGTDEKLLKKYNDTLCSNKAFKRPNKFGSTEFIVCHYAGEVQYDIPGFIEKNKDTVSEVVNKELGNSQSTLLSLLYQQEAPQQQVQQQQQKAFGQVSAPQGGGLKGNSLSNQFRTQLHELMHILKESSPRYIRCIKPNSVFTPHDFDSIDVCKQLRCAGMLEAIRIRKAGYAIRVTMDDFVKRYRAVLDKKKYNQMVKSGANNKIISEAIFKEVLTYPEYKKILDPSLKKWQIGVTKVFMKEDVKVSLEASMGLAVLAQAKHIQRLWKGFKARKLYKVMLKANKFIKKYILKFVRRRRLRKVVIAVIQRMRKAIKKIKAFYRRRRLHYKVIAFINNRIKQKKIEAEKRRQEEERKRKIQEEEERKRQLKQEELERKRRQAEEVSQFREDENSNNNNSSNNNRTSNLQPRQIVVPDDEYYDNENSMNMTSSNTRQNFSNDSSISQQENHNRRANQRPPLKQEHIENANGKSSRFDQNIQKLQLFLDGNDDLESMQELQQQLNEKIAENTDLKSQLERMSREMDDKDKKIKELNIRLEAQRKNQQNRANRDLDNILGQDISKIEMSFTTMDERTSMRPSQFNLQTPLRQTPGNFQVQELEKMLDQKEEELQTFKNKLDLIEIQLQSKTREIEYLKEENEQLADKNKKWVSQMNQDIDKNNNTINSLTKQIKELQDKNFKLEFELKERSLENEKRAFKDQAEEIKKLEQALRSKQDQLDDMELQKFNLQEKLVKDTSTMQLQSEQFRRQLAEYEDKYHQVKTQLESVEEQFIEKDEINNKLEEENQILLEQVKLLQQRLENMGEHQTSFMENLEQERIMSTVSQQKIKDLTRDLEKYKGIEKLKQEEIENIKLQQDKSKRQIRDLQNENEELVNQNLKLKNDKAELEREIMLMSGGQVDPNQDYEKKKLREKVEELDRKYQKKKAKAKALNNENNFYHQTTTLFLTIKKIVEKEKKFCFMLATETDVIKKSQLKEAITLCSEKTKQLDKNLKKILMSAKQSQQSKQQSE